MNEYYSQVRERAKTLSLYGGLAAAVSGGKLEPFAGRLG